MGGLVLSQEDWIAIATVSAGTGASIVAVLVGYYLQGRTLKKERLRDSAASAVTAKLRFDAAGRAFAGLRRVDEDMKPWASAPTSKQMVGAVAVIDGLIVALGSPAVRSTTLEELNQLSVDRVRTRLNEAMDAANRKLVDAHEAFMSEAAKIDLVGPDKGLLSTLVGIISDARQAVYTETDPEKLRIVLYDHLSKLREVLSPLLS
jgi:hypothetical protein